MILLSTLVLVVFAVTSASAFTQAEVQFQQETLERHNQLRARHCAPALQLDNELCETAQAYAEYLASTNRFEHSNSDCGENLYSTSSSVPFSSLHGSKATQSWYDEIEDYSYNTPGFSMETGHFTQVVWKGTTRLGVGIAFCDNGRKAVVVANYSPPGNYRGQFRRQVGRAQC